MVNVRQGYSVGYANSAFIFFLENDVRWVLVNPNAKTFQLVLNDSFLGKGLIDI